MMSACLPVTVFRALNVVPIAGIGFAGDTLQRNAYLVTYPDDSLGFFADVFVQLAVFGASNQNAHLVVIDLTKLIQVQASS